MSREQPQLVGFITLDETTRNYLVRAASIGRRVLLLEHREPPPLAFDNVIATLHAMRCQEMTTVGADRDSPDAVLVTVPEAALRLSLSTRSVHRLIGTGRLRSVLVGRRRLIPAEALEALAKEAG
jgi:excisionase family DNA binding protein